jgi:type I restriction enzyme S subunit
MMTQDFPSHWELRNLGGVDGLKPACIFLDNLRVPINEEERSKRPGPFPYYGANGQQGWIDDFIFDEELVLLAEDGGFFFSNTRPASYRVSGKCWVNNHAHVLRSENDVLPDWLNACLAFADYTEFIPEPNRPKLNQKSAKRITIPVPPFGEQQKIIARIKGLTDRAETARKIAIDRDAELDILLQAIYSRMMEDAEWQPLEKVASLVRRTIKTKPDEAYEEMGIRSFGKGTFKKPVLTGKQIGGKRIYRIHEGDLVFSNVFAWEKAIAVTKAEDHGRVGSHRFITYVPHEGKATSEFLCYHFLGERGIEDIRAASPGSAGRNRTLGLKKLEKILVPVPDYDEQKRFAEIAKRRQLIQQESASIEDDVKSFTAALLAKAFRGEL